MSIVRVRFLLGSFSFACVIALLILTDALPILRGGFGWQWPYLPVAAASGIGLVLCLLGYFAGAYLLLRRETRMAWVFGWAIIGALALTALVIHLRHPDVVYELYTRTASVLTTGQHRAGADIGLGGAAWRDWDSFIHLTTWAGGHVAVAPPGIPMFYALLSALFDAVPAVSQRLASPLIAFQCSNYNFIYDTPGEWASAWFGVLMPVWAALAVFPLYGVARRMGLAHPYARLIVLAFPLVPSLSLFAPTWSTFYPFISLCIVWLLIAGLEKRSLGRLLLAGLLLGAALFMNYTFLPLGAFVGIYAALYIGLTARRDWRWLLPAYLCIGIGVSIPWLLYWLGSGTAPWQLIAANFDTHLEIDRPYLPWIFIHVWDWILYNGVALVPLWIAGVVYWLRKRDGAPPVLALALLATVLLLAISGTARGESGRVWAFFTPLLLLAAGDGLQRIYSVELRLPLRGVVLVGQGVMLLALALSLDVMNSGLNPPPTATFIATTRDYIPTNVLFADPARADQFRLTGWAAEQDGDSVRLALRWQGEEQGFVPYWFGAVLVAPDGAVYDAGVWQPGQERATAANNRAAERGTYPTTCWQQGKIVEDTVLLTLPNDAAAGNWWVSLAAFDATLDGETRLMTTLPDGTTDGQVGLGPIPLAR